MFRHYFITAFRNLLRNKVTSVIHIVGLALGIFSCICIWLYVSDEESYDMYHSKRDRIYRIGTNIKHEDSDDKFALTSFKAPIAIAERFTDAEAVVRMFGVGSMVKVGEVEHNLSEAYLVDTTFFDVFDAAFIAGNPQKALKEPNSIVITKEIAERFFGTADPMGKDIKFTRNVYVVTGVVDGNRYNTSIPYDALLSMNTLTKETQETIGGTDWYRMTTYSYVLLKEGVKPETFIRNASVFVKQEIEPWIKENGLNSTLVYFLQPLIDLRFSTEANYDPAKKTNKAYIYIFALTGVFILLIACFNYINLSTAAAAKRAKEVAVRKVSGATQPHLIWQFLGESMLLTFISLIASLILLEVALPLFNGLAEKQFSFTKVFNWQLASVLAGIMLVITILGGFYPAFIMSRFNPIAALRSNRLPSSGNSWLRKSLVISQFALSIAMIIATIAVYRQLDYMKHKDIGFKRNNIVAVEFPFGMQDSTMMSQIHAFESETRKIPGVNNVATASHIPGKNMGRLLYFIDGKDGKPEEREMYCLFADHDFLKMMGIPLSQGRYFDRNITTDGKGAFILNEAAVKYLDWKEPLGKVMENGFEYKGPVVGVVKDFNFASLHNPVEPLVILVTSPEIPYRYIMVDIDGKDVPAKLDKVKNTWQNMLSKQPFTYTFLDADLQQLYAAEDKMFRVFCYFSAVAVLISCMGVFGLAMFVTRQRTKEIGIRKVMGATEGNILMLINRDFIKLVLVSVLIACPLAWLGMQQWLQKFAYRTELGIVVLFTAALLAVLLAFITVSVQTYRTASANPVKSLRYE